MIRLLVQKVRAEMTLDELIALNELLQTTAFTQFDVKTAELLGEMQSEFQSFVDEFEG